MDAFSPIFGQAYNKAATVGIAVNGFAACGIWPFNENIFTDEDFAPWQVTDVPIQHMLKLMLLILHLTQFVPIKLALH